MSNTILAANLAMTAADCSTPSVSTLLTYGYNLIGNSSGCALSGGGIGDLLNIDAKLEVLSSNGGSTMTHALTTMSPAVNAGRPGGCLDQASAPLSVDQRGQPRPSGSTGSDRCDIGAFEL